MTAFESLALVGFLVVLAAEYGKSAPEAYKRQSALQGSSCAIFQGGGIPLFNGHIGEAQQRWALDIARPLGRRDFLAGLREDTPGMSAYEQVVRAPCSGSIAVTVDDHPDQPLGSLDEDHPWGNCLVLHYSEDIRVRFAHLRKGSMLVRAGEQVAVGQALGNIGNSGRTTVPPLHLDAQKRVDDLWQALPTRFDGRLLRKFDRIGIKPARPVPMRACR